MTSDWKFLPHPRAFKDLVLSVWFSPGVSTPELFSVFRPNHTRSPYMLAWVNRRYNFEAMSNYLRWSWKKKSKRKNNDAWWWWLDSICDSNFRYLICIQMCIHKILQFKKSSCKVKSFLANNFVWYCPHAFCRTGQLKSCSNATPPWPLNSLSKKHKYN